MKSRIAVIVLFAAVIAAGVEPLLAQAPPDPRIEKRTVVIELLKTIDTRHLTQSMIEMIALRVMNGPLSAEMASMMSADQKRGYEAETAKQRQKARTMLDRLFARMDYAKYDAEVYLPIFEKELSTNELRELVAFYKTKAGRSASRVMPELSMGAFVHGLKLLDEDARIVQEEMAKEEDAKRQPWERTMRDLRTIVTATDSCMTDQNKLPDVHDIRDLAKALEPVYVRTLPQTDGWGETYVVVVSSDRTHYRIISKGADGRLDSGSDTLVPIDEKVPPRRSSSLDDDIIYQDGTLIQYPAIVDDKTDK